MNYLVQRGKVRGQVINVPDGFPELLSDITREVLRCQPTKECLCQFIIDYLHSIIVAREKAMVAKGVIDRALRKVDEIISDMCICDITKEKADEMAIVMEECFKRFLEKRRCERGKEKQIIRFDEEDLLDELIKKCKFSADELKVSRPLIEEAYNRFVQAYMAAADNTDGTEALYQYFRERELRRWEEKIRNEAATKIQANFRGYVVRRSLIDKMLPKLPQGYKIGLFGEVPSELYREMDKAARTIQRFFKDHFPSITRLETWEGEEEQTGSICTHHSKETIIGEPYGATAPDERPPPPVPLGFTEEPPAKDIESGAGEPIIEDEAVPEEHTATAAVEETEGLTEAVAEHLPEPLTEEANAAEIVEPEAEATAEPPPAPAPEATAPEAEPTAEAVTEGEATAAPAAESEAPPPEPAEEAPAE